MRKIIFFNLLTVDGFFEGRDHDITWHNVDDEFNEFATQQLNAADGLIFGRKTYELMVGYWPTKDAIKNDPVVAEKMNSIPKIVFSHTLEKVEWNHTRLIQGDIVEELKEIKQQAGKDLYIFGSSDLSVTLAEAGIIDEYRFIMNAIILGQGKAILHGLSGPLKLKLLKTRTFRNGNVLLTYAQQSEGK